MSGRVDSSMGTAYFDCLRLSPRSTTQYIYDSGGNYVTDVIDPSGNQIKNTYDTAGNLTSVTDANGRTAYYGYDVLNNLETVTDTAGNVSRYDFDPVSLQVDYRDARSSSPEDDRFKTSFTYNELNQIVNTVDPLGRETTNTYYDAGNLSSTELSDARKVTYLYDEANRLKEKSYSHEATKYSCFYDPSANLKQVTDDKGKSYVFTYDKANRLTSATDTFNYKLDYTLDKAGNVTAVKDSDNRTIAAYTYGSANQLLTLTDSAGKQNKFSYDESGRPFEVIKGNGIKALALFDEAGRLSQIADPGLVSTGTAGNASTYFYSHDKNGNITEIRKDSGMESFVYDELNRLISWTNESSETTTYGYDQVGNLTKKGDKEYTYDAANEITNIGFIYDLRGNLISDGAHSYDYNTDNQIVKVTKVEDSSTVATYEYNYQGLRVSKTTSAGTIRYHWDSGGRLIRESDVNGNTLAVYTYNDEDQLIAIEKNGKIYYAHTNHRGDIIAITDSNKNVVAAYKYGPWGELIGKSGSFEQPFRYAGYYYDEETGLYYLKARYYSPELGRFLTKDPADGVNADPRTLNQYVYADDNPVMSTDPDGHYAVPVPMAPPVSMPYGTTANYQQGCEDLSRELTTLYKNHWPADPIPPAARKKLPSTRSATSLNPLPNGQPSGPLSPIKKAIIVTAIAGKVLEYVGKNVTKAYNTVKASQKKKKSATSKVTISRQRGTTKAIVRKQGTTRRITRP